METERCHICDSKGENIERNDRKMADSMLEDEKKKIGKWDKTNVRGQRNENKQLIK